MPNCSPGRTVTIHGVTFRFKGGGLIPRRFACTGPGGGDWIYPGTISNKRGPRRFGLACPLSLHTPRETKQHLMYHHGMLQHARPPAPEAAASDILATPPLTCAATRPPPPGIRRRAAQGDCTPLHNKPQDAKNSTLGTVSYLPPTLRGGRTRGETGPSSRPPLPIPSHPIPTQPISSFGRGTLQQHGDPGPKREPVITTPTTSPSDPRASVANPPERRHPLATLALGPPREPSQTAGRRKREAKKKKKRKKRHRKMHVITQDCLPFAL